MSANSHCSFEIEALEPRLLLSADGMAALAPEPIDPLQPEAAETILLEAPSGYASSPAEELESLFDEETLHDSEEILSAEGLANEPQSEIL